MKFKCHQFRYNLPEGLSAKGERGYQYHLTVRSNVENEKIAEILKPALSIRVYSDPLPRNENSSLSPTEIDDLLSKYAHIVSFGAVKTFNFDKPLSNPCWFIACLSTEDLESSESVALLRQFFCAGAKDQALLELYVANKRVGNGNSELIASWTPNEIYTGTSSIFIEDYITLGMSFGNSVVPAGNKVTIVGDAISLDIKYHLFDVNRKREIHNAIELYFNNHLLEKKASADLAKKIYELPSSYENLTKRPIFLVKDPALPCLQFPIATWEPVPADNTLLVSENEGAFASYCVGALLNNFTVSIFINKKGFPEIKGKRIIFYIAIFNKGQWHAPDQIVESVEPEASDYYTLTKVDFTKGMVRSWYVLEIKYHEETPPSKPIPKKLCFSIGDQIVEFDFVNPLSPYLAIDLGTTAVCVSLFRNAASKHIALQTIGAAPEELIEPVRFLLPSVVGFIYRPSGAGQKLEITEVLTRIVDLKRSDHVLQNMAKGLMEMDDFYYSGGRIKTEDLLVRVYGKVMEKILPEIKEACKNGVKKVVFSRPNNYRNKFKPVYDAAFQVISATDSGIIIKEPTYSLISESEAVLAHCYTYFPGNHLVIFDLGGGTTDMSYSIIEKQGNNYDIKILCNICLPLGGNFFDFLLAEAFSTLLEEPLRDFQTVADDDGDGDSCASRLRPSVRKDDLYRVSKFINHSNQQDTGEWEELNDFHKELKRFIVDLKINYGNEQALLNSIEKHPDIFRGGILTGHQGWVQGLFARLEKNEVKTVLGKGTIIDQLTWVTKKQIDNIIDFAGRSVNKQPTGKIEVLVSGRAARFSLIRKILAGAKGINYIEDLPDSEDDLDKYCVAYGAPLMQFFRDKETVTFSEPILRPRLFVSIFSARGGSILKRTCLTELHKTNNHSIHEPAFGLIEFFVSYCADPIPAVEEKWDDFCNSPLVFDHFVDEDIFAGDLSITVHESEHIGYEVSYKMADWNKSRKVTFNIEERNNEASAWNETLVRQAAWPFQIMSEAP